MKEDFDRAMLVVEAAAVHTRDRNMLSELHEQLCLWTQFIVEKVSSFWQCLSCPMLSGMSGVLERVLLCCR